MCCNSRGPTGLHTPCALVHKTRQIIIPKSQMPTVRSSNLIMWQPRPVNVLKTINMLQHFSFLVDLYYFKNSYFLKFWIEKEWKFANCKDSFLFYKLLCEVIILIEFTNQQLKCDENICKHAMSYLLTEVQKNDDQSKECQGLSPNFLC